MRLGLAIVGLSSAVIGFLFWLIYGYETPGVGASDHAWLPAFNACMNGLSALCVVGGILAIRRHRPRLHGVCMLGATLASAAFLGGYIAHHALHGDSKFGGTGWVRGVYFAILITHVLLSMVVVPLILGTLSLAALRRWPAHRRLARWTYPVWLYVSVSGIAVFAFLRLG